MGVSSSSQPVLQQPMRAVPTRQEVISPDFDWNYPPVGTTETMCVHLPGEGRTGLKHVTCINFSLI